MATARKFGPAEVAQTLGRQARERAATVRRFATAVATGGVVLDASHALDALVSGLCEIRGIGPWTAHYIAMRAGGERDAFPGADLGLRDARDASRLARVRGRRRRDHDPRPFQGLLRPERPAPALGPGGARKAR